MFLKKKEQNVNQQPIGFTKSRKILFFKIRSKPIYSKPQPQAKQKVQQPNIQQTPFTQPIPQRPQQAFQAQQPSKPKGKPSALDTYAAKVALKHKELEAALHEAGVKESETDFIKKMMINAIIVAVVIAAVLAVLLLHFKLGLTGILLAAVMGYAMYMVLFQHFLMFPLQKSKQLGKGVERDILFAARDLVVSLRSGMPLFNAITAVSSGYGDASKEFAKIVELVQLGMPIEEAIDRVSEQSKSPTFKRIMLQASVSIKSGSDVASALQGVVEDVTNERVIELRRYGQKLNALAMFYMLFGVIFPSMGIAVAAILTTFINIFTVTPTVLMAALVGIFFLQFIFVNIMRGSRPSFGM